MNFVSEYIKYLLKAKGRHGIHSPFVYDFVDVCLKRKLAPEFVSDLKILRKTLNKDRTLVETADFGAGSRKLEKIRSVKSIYKTASCKGVYASLLYQLTRHYQPKNVLELGTSLGLGAIHLASGNNSSHIVSVDACQNTSKQAGNAVEFMKLTNIQLINETFDSFLASEKYLDAGKFDLVYVDGHHDGGALKKYMQKLKLQTHENTIFVLDDIRWSQGMFAAWNDLSQSEEFHLSMDLFRMGILIRRPGQVKEHFVIKLKNVLSGF